MHFTDLLEEKRSKYLYDDIVIENERYAQLIQRQGDNKTVKSTKTNLVWEEYIQTIYTQYMDYMIILLLVLHIRDKSVITSFVFINRADHHIFSFSVPETDNHLVDNKKIFF